MKNQFNRDCSIWRAHLPDYFTSSGTPLIARGPAESCVDYYIHLCFASHRLWLYSRTDALAALNSGKGRPFSGSRRISTDMNTGRGFNFLPLELRAKCYDFTPIGPWSSKTLGADGERECLWWLRGRFLFFRRATAKEQKSGIDFFVAREDNDDWLSFDAKAREKNYPFLPVQTHEANSDKLWK